MKCVANKIVPAVALSAIVWAGGGTAEEFEITRWTVDGGGVMWSSGGDLELCGTIGQPDAASLVPAMSGGNLTLNGGFWFPLAAGDGNMDGGVDLIDYYDFEVCMSGPDGGSPSSQCRCLERV